MHGRGRREGGRTCCKLLFILVFSLPTANFDSFSSFLSSYFAGIPHLGGTNESYQQALYIEKEWKDYGLDKVELKKYNILLSYPKRPGVVALLDENGKVLHKSAPQESILEPAENNSRNIWPYNAYSPSGDVQVSILILIPTKIISIYRRGDVGISSNLIY